MGERKGTNHYYPPDYDPSKGGLNKFLGTHALRERARKLHLGILIIRFEMPYNIWCDGCGNHIGMGVRYNAEKTKVGMYYSTPLYQFRMKCHLCDNHFEIKTDPGNLDYVIVSGARRQENRWDPTQNGQIVPDDKVVQKRLFDDAMFKLEHGERDQDQAKAIKPALSRLASLREDLWRDDYSANCALRAKFRAKRRELKAKEEKDKALLIKSSLDITLLPETEEDRKMAALLSLAPSKSVNERKYHTREEIINRPALPSCSGNSTTFMGVRAAKQLEKRVTKNCLGILTKSRTICKSKKWKFPTKALIFNGNDVGDNCVENFNGEALNGSERTSESSSSTVSSPENSSTSLESITETPENSSASVETCEETSDSSSTPLETCVKTPENSSTLLETCAETPENSSRSTETCVKTPDNSSTLIETCAESPDKSSPEDTVSMDAEQDDTASPVLTSNNVSLVSGDYDFSSSDESV